MTHDELQSKALARNAVKKEYDALEPEFALSREMLLVRQKARRKLTAITPIFSATID